MLDLNTSCGSKAELYASRVNLVYVVFGQCCSQHYRLTELRSLTEMMCSSARGRKAIRIYAFYGFLNNRSIHLS